MRACPACGFESEDATRCARDGATLVIVRREPDLVGVVLKETYHLTRKIGEGGFGAVYEGLQQPLERRVAVKTLRPGLERNPELVKRFFREARLLSQMSHPNIVQVHDCGNTAEGIFFLVMELLEGQPLGEIVPADGLPLPALVDLFGQVGAGVGEAHRRGLVHRDLKPGNVFVTWASDGRPRVKVLDFGLARAVGVDTNLTQGGAMLGTPGYAAPEQITGEVEPDARADVYALGALLHLLATGRPAYPPQVPGPGAVPAILGRQLAGPPDEAELSRLRRHPPALREVILRALERTPDRRFQSVADLFLSVLEVARGMSAGQQILTAELPAAPPSPPLLARTATLSGAPALLAGVPTAATPWPAALPPTATLTPGPVLLPNAAPSSAAAAAPGGSTGAGDPASMISLRGLEIGAPRAPARRRPGRRALLLGGSAAAVAGTAGAGLAARHFGWLGARPPLLLGMSAAFSGPAEDLGRSMRAGLEARLRDANQARETARPLQLLPLDDGYEPGRTRQNMARLLGTERVLAVVGNVGTPTTEVALPMALASRTPFVGAFTGADLLRRDPPDRYVFNYRASYARESAAAVDHLVRRRRFRPDRIAVFAQQDGFGDAGMRGVARALDAWGVTDPKRIVRVGYQRNSADVESAVARIAAERDAVEAIIMIATYRPAARFIDGLRRAGVHKPMASLSFVDADSLSDELRERNAYVEDIMVTQVVPPPTSNASAVLAYRASLARHAPEAAPGFVSLEGYVVGCLVVEACRRCRRFDAEALVEAFESIRGFDLGLGVPIDYGPSDHDGSDRVWATVLGPDYRYQAVELT